MENNEEIKPCPCGSPNCKKFYAPKVTGMDWRMDKDIALLVAAAPEGLRAAEDAYFLLCLVPYATIFRVASDYTRARLRNYIAAATGRTEEDVQNDFEARTAQ